MDILYLAHRVPYPPNKGDKLRAFRHIEHLACRHRVWCACFVDNPRDVLHVQTLKKHCVDVLAVRLNRPLATLQAAWGLGSGRTATEAFYRHRRMRKALRELAERIRFDAVVAFSSSMAPYALGLPAGRRVLDLCDCDSRKWLAFADHSAVPMRAVYRREGERLAVRERAWAKDFDATMVVTESETQTLRPFVDRDKLHVVGNGVNLPDATPSSFEGESGGEGRGPQLPVVGFVGVMNYFPNVDAVRWFVQECWPMIRAQVPGAEFRIVGRRPAWSVRRLARITGVTVVGEVHDVAHELRQFDVSIAPMRIACGVQNKVLEAMAAAKPVVLTPKVAAALGAADGRNCLIAVTPDRMARAVVRMLLDPLECARIGDNGRRLVASRFRWDDPLRRLELIVTGQIARSAQTESLAMPSVVQRGQPNAVASQASPPENQPV